MTDLPDIIVGGRPPRNPFRAEELPLIARLCRIGFHRYRRRWTKRLFKRPGRKLFDIAHGLGLGGRGVMTLAMPTGPRRLSFDARQTHFRNLYDDRPNGLEPEVAAIMETLLTGEGAFFDVGANWGYFALYAATIPGFVGPVHAFEPIPGTFGDLDRLAREAGLDGRLVRHRLALSDRDGEGTMAVDPVETGLARLDASGGVRVRLARLDGLGLPTPWLMKVDVENHESEMFRGAEATLRRAKPFVVFENWISKNDPQATLRPLRYLESLGYALYLPCWRFTDGSGSYDWPAAAEAPRSYDRRCLSLIRFRADIRFQFSEQINALACPTVRAAELERMFTGAFSSGSLKADLG